MTEERKTELLMLWTKGDGWTVKDFAEVWDALGVAETNVKDLTEQLKLERAALSLLAAKLGDCWKKREALQDRVGTLEEWRHEVLRILSVPPSPACWGAIEKLDSRLRFVSPVHGAAGKKEEHT